MSDRSVVIAMLRAAARAYNAEADALEELDRQEREEWAGMMHVEVQEPGPYTARHAREHSEDVWRRILRSTDATG